MSTRDAPVAEAPSTDAPPAPPRWPGLLLTAGLAALATLIARIDVIGQTLHLGPVVLAILLGAALRNTVALPARLQPGIRVSLKTVLSAAIVLLGFELSLGEVISIGGAGLAVVTLVVASTLSAAYAIGRALGVRRRLSLLIAAGCSICGTSAIIAADAALGSGDAGGEREDAAADAAYAVAVVSALGTGVMFAYPLAQAVLGLAPNVYGVWAGASVHSVGQAVAAGFAVSPQAGQITSLVKLTRVVFIAPVTLGLSLLAPRGQAKTARTSVSSGLLSKIKVPWFVLGFLAAIILNSTSALPEALTDTLVKLDGFLLATAMAAMGLEMRIGDLRAMGLTPLWAGVLATCVASGLALTLALLMF